MKNVLYSLFWVKPCSIFEPRFSQLVRSDSENDESGAVTILLFYDLMFNNVSCQFCISVKSVGV